MEPKILSYHTVRRKNQQSLAQAISIPFSTQCNSVISTMVNPQILTLPPPHTIAQSYSKQPPAKCTTPVDFWIQ